MSRATFDRSAIADILYKVINAPVAMLSGVALSATLYVRNRRAENLLRSLDDRMLKDIGITRGAIHERVWRTKR